MPPGIPQPPIPPRQPGETVYAYRNRRSIATTGQSLYQRRKAAGIARGLSVSEARGHAPAPSGQTEYQTRRQQYIQQYGMTPSQVWRQNQIQWLNDNGFTPATTGWSWSKLITAAPRLRWLNSISSPGAQITPDIILEAMDIEMTGGLESEWSWNRFNERYESTREYVQYNDKTLGNWHWFHDRIPDMPVQWWYYH